MNTKIPFHEESERGILGICLFNGAESVEEVLLVPNVSSLFHDDRNAEIWARLETLHRENKPLDIGMVAKTQIQIKVELEYLSQLASESLSAANLAQYLAIAAEYQKRRLVMRIGLDLLNNGQREDKPIDAVIESAESSMFSLRETQQEEKTIKSGLITVMNDWESAFNNKGKMTGIASGLYDLDKMTWGFQKRQLIIIGARPSQGKTALLGTIITHCAINQKIPTLLFSLESSMEEILKRIICSQGKLNSAKLRAGDFNEKDFAGITNISGLINRSPLYIIDRGDMSITQMRSIARRYVKKFGVKLIAVDYLQKVKPAEKKEKRTYEVSQVSEGLKEMAKECDVPVLTACQLNRESDKDNGKQKQPRLPRVSDLGDSGSIERDADLIALLYRMQNQTNPDLLSYQLIIGKHRDGEIGFIPLLFRKASTRFENESDI